MNLVLQEVMLGKNSYYQQPQLLDYAAIYLNISTS